MSLKSCKFLWAAAIFCKQLEPYVVIYVKFFYISYFIILSSSDFVLQNHCYQQPNANYVFRCS